MSATLLLFRILDPLNRLFEIHETESERFNIRLPDRLSFGHPGLNRHAVASRRYGRDLRVVSAARRSHHRGSHADFPIYDVAGREQNGRRDATQSASMQR